MNSKNKQYCHSLSVLHNSYNFEFLIITCLLHFLFYGAAHMANVNVCENIWNLNLLQDVQSKAFFFSFKIKYTSHTQLNKSNISE